MLLTKTHPKFCHTECFKKIFKKSHPADKMSLTRVIRKLLKFLKMNIEQTKKNINIWICHLLAALHPHAIGRKSHYSNHPWAHTVKLGRMTTRKKSLLPLATLPNLVLSHLSAQSDPIVLKPFDVTLWYSGEPRTPNLLKILEMAFPAHFTQIWKLNRISMMLPPGPARRDGALQWGEIVQWGLKGWSR